MCASAPPALSRRTPDPARNPPPSSGSSGRAPARAGSVGRCGRGGWRC